MIWLKYKKKKKENVQRELKNPIIKIIPLTNHFTVGVITQALDANVISFSVFKKDTRRTHTFAIDKPLAFLPSGLYLTAIDPKIKQYAHQYQTALDHLCEGSNALIKESLNLSLVSAVNDKKLLAVGQDQRTLYFYNLNQIINQTLSGLFVFQSLSPQIQINAIAAAEFQSQPLIAIGLTSGVILIGNLKSNQFYARYNLDYLQYGKHPELLISNKGYLIAYFKEEGKLKIWNIYKPSISYLYSDMNLLSLKMSAGDDFLTAVADQDKPTSNKIHVFDLKNSKHHCLIFNEQLNDFAIGYKGRVCLAIGSTLKYQDIIENYISSNNAKLFGPLFFNRIKEKYSESTQNSQAQSFEFRF